MLNNSVPLNTMLADLDDSLRSLLRRDLAKHGFDGVEIAFEAPDKEWSASLSSPAVNVFLYDLREAKEIRPVDWTPISGDGRVREYRPPLRLDASYAVTGWTRAVEDEHRLLSQVMAILYAYPELPEEALTGTLRNGAQRYPVRCRTATDRHEGAADFWTAVGGQYKVSVNYVVTLSCESGTVLERGPEVRTRTLRVYDGETPGSTLTEMHGAGGVVVDSGGKPASDAWVVLRETGKYAATDSAGRFRFDRLVSGSYHLIARGRDGTEAESQMVIPGGQVNMSLAKKAESRPKRR